MKNLHEIGDKELREELMSAAMGIQKICDFDEAPQKKSSIKQLEKWIKQAYKFTTTEDNFSEDVYDVFDYLGLKGHHNSVFAKKKEEKKKEKKKPKEDSIEVEARDEEKVEKKEIKKKEKRPSLAGLLDDFILKGGSWDELSEKCTEASDDFGGVMKYTPGVLRAHIGYRLSKNPKYLSDVGLDMTDEGVLPIKKSKKK